MAASNSRFGPQCAGAPPWHPVVAAIAWAGTCGAAGPVLAAAEAAAPSPQIHDPATAAPNWQTSDRGVVLSAAHITPAQAHAFYRARGFEPDAAAHYAAACVFQIVLRNDAAGGTLTNRLADWRIGTGAAEQRFVPLESWEREWARRGVAEPARIAFRWAQFPAEQQFEPGDWIMGMAALAPRPAGSFDLIYEWSIDGVSRRGTLPGLRCADAD
jgi:hypothetical protein